MSLTLAIPVLNDLPGLIRLLSQDAVRRCADRIVILDDGSDDPVTIDALLPARSPLRDRIHILRNPSPTGPGCARNRLLTTVKTSHVLYCDSDDILTPEFPGLWDSLQTETYDFCLFNHADSRMTAWGGWGPMPLDACLWHAAGLDRVKLAEADHQRCAHLVQTANYPWNKIYRTGFLRDHGIGCSEIIVHEDIELHWMSFLQARRVLVSARVGASHTVTPGGARLTNRTGPERLAVFDPLHKIAHILTPLYRQPFARFISGFFRWLHANLDAAFHAALAERIRRFLVDWLTPDLVQELIQRDPLTTHTLLQHMHPVRTRSA